jgi:alanine dehydrogenase
MNFGVIRETSLFDRRVALTPAVARQLVNQGDAVWVETGAGNGAKYPDDDYLRAGAHIGYGAAEVIRRSEVLLKVSMPSLEELELCAPGQAVMAFFHMAAADHALFQRLVEQRVTSVGCEIIQTESGQLPVLAAQSEIAGQMTISVATTLLRSSMGGRGIMLGGSPGVPPANVVILGAGTVGTWAARTAAANGASVMVVDRNAERLRYVLEHVPHVATALSDPEVVAEAVARADVVIGAILVAGWKAPHIVTREMVERMRPGSVIIDVAIDQGGCVETSRPTTLAEPVFLYLGISHYCVPNLTADVGRSASVAVAQSLMPYLLQLGEKGLEGVLAEGGDLARGVYTYRGVCVNPALGETQKTFSRPLAELLKETEAGE